MDVLYRRRQEVVATPRLRGVGEALRSIDFFAAEEAAHPGLIAELSRVGAVRLDHERVGQVVFRQDDAPTSVYGVVSGSVGVYARAEKQYKLTPRSMGVADPESTLTEVVCGPGWRDANGEP